LEEKFSINKVLTVPNILSNNITQQILIVKVVLEDGNVITKKNYVKLLIISKIDMLTQLDFIQGFFVL
jgi:hypothetical protein